MRRPMRNRYARAFGLCAAMLASAAAGCRDGTGPNAGVPESELTFVRQSATAPTLAGTTARFWAKRGEDREVRMYYRPRAEASDSSLFLEFRVPAGALERRPDGSAFAAGDSVLITITVTDPSTLRAEFAPSGLRFSARTPARLRIEFDEADDDFDGDGDVDATDARIESQLSVWRQEGAGQPWYKQSSVVAEDIDDVEAEIFGFTAYAIAF